MVVRGCKLVLDFVDKGITGNKQRLTSAPTFSKGSCGQDLKEFQGNAPFDAPAAHDDDWVFDFLWVQMDSITRVFLGGLGFCSHLFKLMIFSVQNAYLCYEEKFSFNETNLSSNSRSIPQKPVHFH